MRVKIRDLKTGYTQEKVFRTDERVPKAAVDNRTFQYLYNDGDLYHFMDQETYDEKLMSRDSLGDAANFLTDGLEVEMLVFRDEPVSAQLPTAVQLRIDETGPGVQGRHRHRRGQEGGAGDGARGQRAALSEYRRHDQGRHAHVGVHRAGQRLGGLHQAPDQRTGESGDRPRRAPGEIGVGAGGEVHVVEARLDDALHRESPPP